MPTNNNNQKSFLSRRTDSLVLLLSSVLVISGFILMAGESTTETAFCQDVFSRRRIEIAPLLCLAGYLLMMVGVVWRPDKHS